MKHLKVHSERCDLAAALLLLVGTVFAAGSASAKQGAHVHGLMRMDVALQAQTLTVQIEAPLDTVLGFEHAPRTSAQRSAADALIKRLNEDKTLVRPATAAMCSLTQTTVDAGALVRMDNPPANKPPADKAPTDKAPVSKKDEDAHANISIAYEFTCAQVDKLDSITLGLFDAFKRLQKIEAQVTTPQGQSKQTPTRPLPVLKLKR